MRIGDADVGARLREHIGQIAKGERFGRQPAWAICYLARELVYSNVRCRIAVHKNHILWQPGIFHQVGRRYLHLCRQDGDAIVNRKCMAGGIEKRLRLCHVDARKLKAQAQQVVCHQTPVKGVDACRGVKRAFVNLAHHAFGQRNLQVLVGVAINHPVKPVHLKCHGDGEIHSNIVDAANVG